MLTISPEPRLTKTSASSLPMASERASRHEHFPYREDGIGHCGSLPGPGIGRAAQPLRILMTGFGPFPGVPFNASERLIRDLAEAPPRSIPGARVFAASLPTDWRLAIRKLHSIAQAVRPQIVLHFGVSRRASGLVVETRAFNQTSGRADCSGAQAPQRCVRRGAPAVLMATLPSERLVQRLRMEGVPATLSGNAGRYLCNAVLFESLYMTGAARRPPLVVLVKNRSAPIGRKDAARPTGQSGPLVRRPAKTCIAGFVHIPALGPPEIDCRSTDGLDWTTLRRGGELILETLARAAQPHQSRRLGTTLHLAEIGHVHGKKTPALFRPKREHGGFPPGRGCAKATPMALSPPATQSACRIARRRRRGARAAAPPRRADRAAPPPRRLSL